MAASSATSRPNRRREWRSRRPGSWDSWPRRWVPPPRGGSVMTFFLLASAIKVFVVLNLILVGVALLTLLERRVCAWMQDRLGPNRVGPQGILQPAADGLKNFLKEE